jgi:hypothetical protein
VYGDTIVDTNLFGIIFKDNTFFENVPVKSAFIKTLFYNDEESDSVKEMAYEAGIYAIVKNDIIDTRISPNFLRMYSFNHSCDTKALASSMRLVEKVLLHPSYGSKHVKLTKAAALKIFTDNIERNGVKATIILSEDMTGGMSFEDYYNSKPESGELWGIVLQVFMACRVMEARGITHNDLHWNNIMIVKRDADTPICYEHNGVYYTLRTKLLVKVFDWDMAYTEELGPNIHYNGQGIYSDVVTNRDFYRFCCAGPKKDTTLTKCLGDPEYFASTCSYKPIMKVGQHLKALIILNEKQPVLSTIPLLEELVKICEEKGPKEPVPTPYVYYSLIEEVPTRITGLSNGWIRTSSTGSCSSDVYVVP